MKKRAKIQEARLKAKLWAVQSGKEKVKSSPSKRKQEEAQLKAKLWAETSEKEKRKPSTTKRKPVPEAVDAIRSPQKKLRETRSPSKSSSKRSSGVERGPDAAQHRDKKLSTEQWQQSQTTGLMNSGRCSSFNAAAMDGLGHLKWDRRLVRVANRSDAPATVTLHIDRATEHHPLRPGAAAASRLPVLHPPGTAAAVLRLPGGRKSVARAGIGPDGAAPRFVVRRGAGGALEVAAEAAAAAAPAAAPPRVTEGAPLAPAEEVAAAPGVGVGVGVGAAPRGPRRSEAFARGLGLSVGRGAGAAAAAGAGAAAADLRGRERWAREGAAVREQKLKLKEQELSGPKPDFQRTPSRILQTLLQNAKSSKEADHCTKNGQQSVMEQRNVERKHIDDIDDVSTTSHAVNQQQCAPTQPESNTVYNNETKYERKSMHRVIIYNGIQLLFVLFVCALCLATAKTIHRQFFSRRTCFNDLNSDDSSSSSDASRCSSIVDCPSNGVCHNYQFQGCMKPYHKIHGKCQMDSETVLMMKGFGEELRKKTREAMCSAVWRPNLFEVPQASIVAICTAAKIEDDLEHCQDQLFTAETGHEQTFVKSKDLTMVSLSPREISRLRNIFFFWHNLMPNFWCSVQISIKDHIKIFSGLVVALIIALKFLKARGNHDKARAWAREVLAKLEAEGGAAASLPAPLALGGAPAHLRGEIRRLVGNDSNVRTHEKDFLGKKEMHWKWVAGAKTKVR